MHDNQVRKHQDINISLILQFAYSVSCSHLEQLRGDWRSILDVHEESEESVAVRQLESAIGLYLRRVCSTKDVTDIAKVI